MQWTEVKDGNGYDHSGSEESEGLSNQILDIFWKIKPRGFADNWIWNVEPKDK